MTRIITAYISSCIIFNLIVTNLEYVGCIVKIFICNTILVDKNTAG